MGDRYAVFAWNFKAPGGGWSDLQARAPTADEAVVEMQRLHAFDMVEIVDLTLGEIVYVPRPHPPSCPHGIPQTWDAGGKRWRAGLCAPCRLVESGDPAILSVAGTTPGPTERFRG